MNKTRAGLLSAAGLLMVALAAGGCSENRVTAASVRANPSPELESIAMSHEQRENEHARTIDTDLRQVWDDLDMILLLDKPEHGSRYLIP